MAEAERAAESVRGASALPRQGELTLGGRAGQVLTGLTLRPGTPGPNDVLIYLLPLDGESAAAPLEAQLSVDGDVVPLSQCGPTCRSARTTLQGGSRIDVRVAGKVGGTARFRLPTLPAPPGDDILARMMSAMHALTTYRQGLEAARACSEHKTLIQSQEGMALSYLALGDFMTARMTIEEAIGQTGTEPNDRTAG